MKVVCPICNNEMKVIDTSDALSHSEHVFLRASCDNGHIIEALGQNAKAALTALMSHVQTSVVRIPRVHYNRSYIGPIHSHSVAI